MKSVLILFFIVFPAFMFSQYKDGKALISAMHKKNAGKYCNTLTFKQTTNRYRDGGVQSEVWTEYLEFPDKLRIDIGDTSKGNFMIFKNDSAYRFRSKKLISAARDSNLIMLLLGGMYHRSKKDVLARIQKFGIKLNELSEQVIDGKKCFVIGTKVTNDKVPQIWINKETLCIERFIENYNGSVLEVRVIERQKACSGEVETKLSIYADGKLFQDELYFDVKFNESIPKNIYKTN
ncbi:MAG: hypothetical protein IPG89_06235 [Bacteroidetes bacterium]|nr:hypothetical protein [Bacteroidota bacterium]